MNYSIYGGSGTEWLRMLVLQSGDAGLKASTLPLAGFVSQFLRVHLFPLFQWHVCKPAKCMTTLLCEYDLHCIFFLHFLCLNKIVDQCWNTMYVTVCTLLLLHYLN